MKRNHSGQYTYSQNKSYTNNNKSYGSIQNSYTGGGGGANSSINSYQTNKLNTPPPMLPNTYSVPPPPIADPTRLYYPHNSPNRNTYTNIPSVDSPGTPPSIHNIRNGIVPTTHHPTNYYMPRSLYPPPRIQWSQSITPIPGGPIDTSTPPPPGPPRRWPPPPSSMVMGTNVYVPRPSPPTRKKQRRKTIAQNVPSREIKIEDAEAALKCEMEHTFTTKQLMIRFPDPPIDRDTVLKFNSSIKKVHFQQPSTPRYCFIQLDEDADTEKVIQELREIKFGLGNLRVELKHDATRRAKAEDIDPYVLFVGNISQNTPAETIKNLFHPGRVDIGPSQKIKNSRYALVKFFSAQEAIEVFKKTQGIMVGDHSLNVRFRRLNGSVGFPGDKPVVKKAATTQANNEEEHNKNEETKKTCTNNSSQSKDNNQKSDDITNNDLPPVKKEEEYFYYEHPEPADEMDIKLKNEYFNEQNEYYMEHPEYEYDYDYFYDGGFGDNQDIQSSSSSTYASTMTLNENDHLDANEFAAQLKSQLLSQHNESSSLSSANNDKSHDDLWLGKRNDLGHSVKQIHLPPPPKTAPPEIPPPPPGTPPPSTPSNRSDMPFNLDEIRVKSELENDGYENRCNHDDDDDDENDETREFLSQLQKLSENISNDRSSCTRLNSANNLDKHVSKNDRDTHDYNNKNMDLFVRIPREKIKINSLTSVNNQQDDNKSKNDYLSFPHNG